MLYEHVCVSFCVPGNKQINYKHYKPTQHDIYTALSASKFFEFLYQNNHNKIITCYKHISLKTRTGSLKYSE